MLNNPDQRIPLSAGCELLEATARKTACPTLGLEMAQVHREFDFETIIDPERSKHR
jgi:hypothetical protein